MKNILSSLDLACIIRELNLNNGVIKKIYHTDDELIFHIFINGEKKILRIIIGKLIHLTSFTKENPSFPSNFCMFLRKYLKGGRIISISQLGLERIVSIKVMKGDEIVELIIELFKNGNAIVIINNIIKQVLKYQRFSSREIRPGKQYIPPPNNYDLLSKDFKLFKKALINDGREVVKALAVSIGLGGTYAEEACLISGINKSLIVDELSNDDINKLFLAVNKLIDKALNNEINARVIIDNKKIIDVTPFPLKFYDKMDFKEFNSFNEALDFFYARTQSLDAESSANKIINDKKKKLEKRLREHEEYVNELRNKSRAINDLAMNIKNNLYLIERILNSLINAHKKGFSWNEIKELIKNEQERGVEEALLIKEFNPENNRLVLNIGSGVELSLNTNVRELMDYLFTRAKKLESKINGAIEAVNRVKNEIKSLNIVVKPKVKKIIEKKWFEKFKWFYTSNGFLVISGRNAQQNELLINKYLEPEDLVFHADIHGSPFTLLKNGKKASDVDILEAAQFTATHSSAWNKGISIDVYYVNPYQVTKEAPSGEYLRTGGFMIKGKKSFIKSLKPELCVGVKLIDEFSYKLISGPIKPISLSSKHYLVIVPGSKPVTALTHEIINYFKSKGFVFNFDEVRLILPGDGIISLKK